MQILTYLIGNTPIWYIPRFSIMKSPVTNMPKMNILTKNLLILASAGSGKTFQLGNRVIGLVSRGVPPETIVALTFTRKAAGEFADSVLTKLANAAGCPTITADLRQTLDLPTADFKQTLEEVVRALPRLTLGTMDSFFSKIIRGFQYELGITGGKFDLLEGPRAATLADEMLAGILGDALESDQGDQFFHAFRRATIGREDQGVLHCLRSFVTQWQTLYQESHNLDWGPASLAKVSPDVWEIQKSQLADSLSTHLDDIPYTRSGQKEALEKEIENLRNHVIGGGSLGSKVSSLMLSILDAVATDHDTLTVKSYKEFTISGQAAQTLRDMVHLAAQCEFAAALQRTRAVCEIVTKFDALCATRLRNRGMLGFHDIKLLMGQWARNEDARIRREAVDFRLDARIHHWLLDEFQDTSRADWTGLQPLIDEAATGDDSSMFIVGDRKQAIYAWRGGDVSLFDDVIHRYSGDISILRMDESWRSCPEVLTLVNQVCGDHPTARELFGEIANTWDWQDHVSANPLKQANKRGQARVEVVGKWDERMARTIEILEELGIGRRAMTCGILLRGNQQVREVADSLRTHGFDVIEEGRREPAKDHTVGIVITHLLHWLADPSDVFSLETIKMSPLAEPLVTNYGSTWPEIWTSFTHCISRLGFADAIASLISCCNSSWSDFGHRRSGDILTALRALDNQMEVSPKQAADWIERLEVSQSPGVAAVQVMTIHKAKGLGFDVVILPEVPDDSIPQSQYFDIAEGPDWLTQTPPKWARAIIPEMSEAEENWAKKQRYESFCMLYVALTRAKRGLYILLEPPSKTANPDKPSLANWIRRSLSSSETNGIIHQTGDPDWAAKLPLFETSKISQPTVSLGANIRPLERQTPSKEKSKNHAPVHSPSGMSFGSELHELLESITL